MRGAGRIRGAGLGALPVAIVVLIVGLGGAVGQGQDGAPDGPEEEASDVTTQTSVGTTTSQFTWTSTVTGDFALRMVLEFTALEICTFHIKSAGYVTDRPVLHYTAHDEPGRGWTLLTQEYAFGVHASGISIRSNDYPGGLWAAHSQHDFSARGTEAWLFTGFSLQGWDNEFTNGDSIVLDLACTGPFTIIQIEGGKSALGFIPQYMVGGAGATAPLVDVNMADFAIRTFTEPHVAFRYRSDPFIGAGALMLYGPGISERWTLTGDAEATFDGPAGRYQATMTRAAVGGQAVGILAGLQDVQSFDAAAAL